MAKYFLSHLIGCSFVPITNLKNHKMMLRILPFLLLPLLGLAQMNSKVEIPNVENTSSEKKPLLINRNAQYNLEEIKVRWKKAALENCLGVPCITTTVPGAPSGAVATVGNASASVAFTVPNDGGSAITGYTVTSNPLTPPVTGTTSPINVTGLTNGTAYTFTVVATNAVGNSVASAASAAVTPAAPFTCGTSTVSDVDNNSYNTVLIGTQCWTKQNLKVTKYNDGSAIPLDNTGGMDGITGGQTWSTRIAGAYTIHQNESSTGSFSSTYGGFLYNWYATTDARNICPSGWHVPTDGEWTSLIQFIDPSANASAVGGAAQSGFAGAKLKSSSTLWIGVAGTDDYGFTVLPGSQRQEDATFGGTGSSALFWSSTSDGTTGNSFYRFLFNLNNAVARGARGKMAGFHVRCLKD